VRAIKTPFFASDPPIVKRGALADAVRSSMKLTSAGPVIPVFSELFEQPIQLNNAIELAPAPINVKNSFLSMFSYNGLHYQLTVKQQIRYIVNEIINFLPPYFNPIF
jgi:hypothetical protein